MTSLMKAVSSKATSSKKPIRQRKPLLAAFIGLICWPFHPLIQKISRSTFSFMISRLTKAWDNYSKVCVRLLAPRLFRRGFLLSTIIYVSTYVYSDIACAFFPWKWTTIRIWEERGRGRKWKWAFFSCVRGHSEKRKREEDSQGSAVEKKDRWRPWS